MKNKRKLKKLAAKYVEYSYLDGKTDERKVVKIMEELKSLPRSQAIYIISKFLKGVRKRTSQNTLLIESAVPLPKTQVEKIVKGLKKEFIITKIKNILNPDLLGGFRLTIGDKVYDHSFKGKISQLGEALRA